MSLSAYLFCHAVCIVLNANSLAWFLHIPVYLHILFTLAVLAHIYYAFFGISYLRKNNSEYEEFLKIWEKDEEKRIEELKTSIAGKPGFFKSLASGKFVPYFKAHSRLHFRRLSIKTKFTFVITGVIIVILLAFMLLILNSYKTMFTEAVSDVGRAQAEQTAAVYDTAEGKYDKIATFRNSVLQMNMQKHLLSE